MPSINPVKARNSKTMTSHFLQRLLRLKGFAGLQEWKKVKAAAFFSSEKKRLVDESSNTNYVITHLNNTLNGNVCCFSTLHHSVILDLTSNRREGKLRMLKH